MNSLHQAPRRMPNPAFDVSFVGPESTVESVDLGHSPSSRGFVALLVAFRASGGTAHGDDLARLLEDRYCGDFSTLARLISTHAMFGFAWRGAFWVPMFQFDLRDLSLTRGAAPVVAKLAEAFDGWALAGWFAWPNPSLGGWRPVDVLDATPATVLSAARVARPIHQ